MAKVKNIVTSKDFVLLKSGFSLQIRELNHFTVRLKFEESKDYWDWYHTTGSLVHTRFSTYGAITSKVGIFLNSEELGSYLFKFF